MLKFRASSIANIMQKGKGEPFGQTAKTYLTECFIKEKYGREKQITSKYFEKGHEKEEEAITLLSQFDKAFYFKNEEHFKNEYITGTPDIITNIEVIDIKCPFDIFTFFNHKKDPLPTVYEYQLLSYGALTNRSELTLAYTLVNTPESIFERDSKYKEVNSNLYFYDDIPIEERVYKHTFQFDANKYDELIERCKLANKWIEENLK